MLNYLIVDDLIKASLKEDMPFGDITTESIIGDDTFCTASLICKENGVICGLNVFKRVFDILGDVAFTTNFKDGDSVLNGELIGVLKGSGKQILMGERVALNLLQRMSGISTLTSKYAKELEGLKCKVVDTRKTTPLYRHIDKYSVLCGGGKNHRSSLSQAVMLKDNHIDYVGSIKKAVEMAREKASFVAMIEVECESPQMVEEALEAKCDIIMLDNMTPSMVSEMVKLIDGKAIVECSGNITLENIREYGECGVDVISVGALTHSFKVLDISLKNLKLENKAE
ncbi:MAG: carboxylating nicotinate-nucleotide diphosphorylase [Clostridium sp.]